MSETKKNSLNNMKVHASGRGTTRGADNGEWLVGRVMDDGPTGELFIAANDNGSLSIDHITAPLSGDGYTAIRIPQKHRQWVVAELAMMLTVEEWADVTDEVEAHFENEDEDA